MLFWVSVPGVFQAKVTSDMTVAILTGLSTNLIIQKLNKIPIGQRIQNVCQVHPIAVYPKM